MVSFGDSFSGIVKNVIDHGLSDLIDHIRITCWLWEAGFLHSLGDDAAGGQV
jgi:hypothetical protein